MAESTWLFIEYSTAAHDTRFTVPAAKGDKTRRTLYFFTGDSLTIAGRELRKHSAVEVRAQDDVELVNGEHETELLMLQGRPIGQPVTQYGPFVMNTQQQIQQAMMDYRRTRFGGWPYPDDAPTHGRESRRFAKHADGKLEEKSSVVSRQSSVESSPESSASLVSPERR